MDEEDGGRSGEHFFFAEPVVCSTLNDCQYIPWTDKGSGRSTARFGQYWASARGTEDCSLFACSSLQVLIHNPALITPPLNQHWATARYLMLTARNDRDEQAIKPIWTQYLQPIPYRNSIIDLYVRYLLSCNELNSENYD